MRVPKWLSPRKNTKVAVRLIAFEPSRRPPAPQLSSRLSPVPVLPPMTIGVPSLSLKLPDTRRAVPASTTCERAPRKARATSTESTRWPRSGSPARRVSYGVSAAKCRVSMRRVGRRIPSFWMMPISSARAAGRSPELPMAVASEGTR
ncbi:hypothetical protein D3C79_826900 [compost metagenome]